MNAFAGRRRERGGRIAVPVAVVFAVAAAARSRLGSTPGADAASSASVASPPPAIAYPAGPGALYDVTWDVVTRLPPTLGGAVAATGSQVSLTGRVQVADLGAQGARRLVGVRVRELEAARLEAFGRPLHPTLEAARADLVDQPVVLALSPAGRVDDLYLAPTTSPLAANVLRGLALHFAASLESASATSDGGLPAPTTEPGDFGAVSWRDAWKGTTSELSRVHVGEGSKGTASIVFEGATPRRIQATLEIDESREGRRAGQGRASFSASRAPERAAGDAFPSVDLGTFARHDPTAPVGVADTRAENAALANGMTRADMLAIVAAYNVGKTPERGSIIRVAAFLRTEPRLADDGRELVLDMLASSGDAKAQAVMRALLATTTTADPAARERQVQRFSLVVEPTDESVRFVSDAWQRARMEGPPGVAFAWAHTAGSIVSHARESGRRATTARAW